MNSPFRLLGFSITLHIQWSFWIGSFPFVAYGHFLTPLILILSKVKRIEFVGYDQHRLLPLKVPHCISPISVLFNTKSSKHITMKLCTCLIGYHVILEHLCVTYKVDKDTYKDILFYFKLNYYH